MATKKSATRQRNLLVVMARYPRPGFGKTRLAAELGEEATARIYGAFLRDLKGSLEAASEFSTYWAFAPREAPFEEWLGVGDHGFPQEAGSLGARMRAAFVWGFAKGAESVVVVGSDMPQLEAETVTAAFRALDDGVDTVLGPAEDGGYYLIGARAVPPVFEGVAWSMPTVFAETVAHLDDAGWSHGSLPEAFDVDTIADLRRLAAAIAAGRWRNLKETAAELTRAAHSPQ